MRYLTLLVSLAVLQVSGAPSAAPQLNFVTHEVGTGLRGGYQVIAVDMNKDSRLDLVAVASSIPDLVWYENPGWQRHVIATGLTGMINVAATDLDKDGIPELALAHGFSTNPERSPGNLSLLTHVADLTQPWTVREIDRVPTSHRVRWLTSPNGSEKWLVNAPLVGDSVRAPEYRGVTPIYIYRPPLWKREVLTLEEQGVVHAIEVMPRLPAFQNDGLAVAGFLGVGGYSVTGVGNRIFRMPAASGDPAPWPRSGSSEVSFAQVGAESILATIEPWHGEKVVVYRGDVGRARSRVVIDTTLTDAHALLAADLDGDGRDEIVAGERGGARTVRIYKANVSGEAWTRTNLDAGSMPAASCVAADLNADGRVDLACIGTATANLKWYENVR